jgi:hypothetical protein
MCHGKPSTHHESDLSNTREGIPTKYVMLGVFLYVIAVKEHKYEVKIYIYK